MTSPPLRWHLVCPVKNVPVEELTEFEHDGKIYSVYHLAKGFFATDGLCTHEEVPLVDGMVIGDIIECPRHQGRFHIPTGEARSAPACENLRTYPTKVENGNVYLGLPDGSSG